MEGMHLSSDGQPWDAWPPPRKGKPRKRTKRISSSSSVTDTGDAACYKVTPATSTAGKEPKGEATRLSTPRSRAKRLPTDRERRDELKHQPTANLTANLLEVSEVLLHVAATAKNLKGTYIRRLRDQAGIIRANTAEITARGKSTGPLPALEQEIAQLREELRLARSERDAALKSLKQQHQGVAAGSAKESRPSTDRRPTAAPGPAAAKGRDHSESSRRASRVPTTERRDEDPATLRRDLEALAQKFNIWERRMGESTQRGYPREGHAQPSAHERPSTSKEGTSGVTSSSLRATGQSKGRNGTSPPKAAPGSVIPASEGSTDRAEKWSRVVGRRTKRLDQRKRSTEERQGGPAKQGRRAETKTSAGTSRRETPRRVHTPKSAAITIAMAPGSKRSAKEVLTIAKRRINLEEVGLDEVKVKHTISGATLIEVLGENNVSKAEALADKLRELFPEGGDVIISRPKKRIDVRILGLDESILPKEVALAIAEAGGCEAGEVKVGALRRRSRGSSHTVWAQCPAEAAKKLADLGKLRVGWITARVEALKSRLAICFKCMASGHMAKDCPRGKGAAEVCFNCGIPGHRARNCTAKPRCLACEQAGRQSDHRLGGKACTAPSIPSGSQSESKEMGAATKVPGDAPQDEGTAKREKTEGADEDKPDVTGDATAKQHSRALDPGEGTSRDA